MLNSRRMLLTIIILLCAALPLSATEVDLDYEIKVDSEVREQLISNEYSLKEHRVSLAKENIHLKELHEALEEALYANDQRRLQNVFMVLLPKLKQMQEELAEQSSRIEKHRYTLVRVLQSSERKKIRFEEPLQTDKLMEIGSAIYEQMSKEDKLSIGRKAASIFKISKEIEKSSRLHDQLPYSPYGSSKGLREKHEMAVLDRLYLEAKKEEYAQLEAIATGILDSYIDKELSEEEITESNYKGFLNNFESIIDTLIEEETVENPYSEMEADTRQ